MIDHTTYLLIINLLFIGKKIMVGPPDFVEYNEDKVLTGKKDFFIILLIIILPLFLILIATSFDMMVGLGALAGENFWVGLFQFLGHPFVALTIATLVAAYFLGFRKGHKAKELLEFSDKALAPAGLIILITGAGGMFKQILVESGAGEALAEVFITYIVIPIVMAYVIAAIIRIIQGSATVAMITSAGMMAPIIMQMDISDQMKALIGLSIAAGATILSHVNDSGFWLVKKYLGLTEKQTLQSWTMMETIVSVTAFVTVLFIPFLVD